MAENKGRRRSIMAQNMKANLLSQPDTQQGSVVDDMAEMIEKAGQAMELEPVKEPEPEKEQVKENVKPEELPKEEHEEPEDEYDEEIQEETRPAAKSRKKQESALSSEVVVGSKGKALSATTISYYESMQKRKVRQVCVYLPEELCNYLKYKALMESSQMKDIVTDLVEKDMKTYRRVHEIPKGKEPWMAVKRKGEK